MEEEDDFREQYQVLLEMLLSLEKSLECPWQTQQKEESLLLIPQKTFKNIFEIEDSDLEIYRERLNEYIQKVHPTIQCCKKTKDIWVQNIGRIKGVKFLKAFQRILHAHVRLSKFDVELYPTKHEIVKSALEFIMREKKKEFQVLRYLQDLGESAVCLMCNKKGEPKYRY